VDVELADFRGTPLEEALRRAPANVETAHESSYFLQYKATDPANNVF
jgi:hypothetical protein